MTKKSVTHQNHPVKALKLKTVPTDKHALTYRITLRKNE